MQKTHAKKSHRFARQLLLEKKHQKHPQLTLFRNPKKPLTGSIRLAWYTPYPTTIEVMASYTSYPLPYHHRSDGIDPLPYHH